MIFCSPIIHATGNLPSNPSSNRLPFASTWVHPLFYSGIHVAHLFSFLCCVEFYFCFVCFRPVTCMPDVARPTVCGLCILDCPFGFSLSLRFIQFQQTNSLQTLQHKILLSLMSVYLINKLTRKRKWILEQRSFHWWTNKCLKISLILLDLEISLLNTKNGINQKNQ